MKILIIAESIKCLIGLFILLVLVRFWFLAEMIYMALEDEDGK